MPRSSINLSHIFGSEVNNHNNKELMQVAETILDQELISKSEDSEIDINHAKKLLKSHLINPKKLTKKQKADLSIHMNYR